MNHRRRTGCTDAATEGKHAAQYTSNSLRAMCTARAYETASFSLFLGAGGSSTSAKKYTPSTTHRLLSDGLPEVDLLEPACGLVENLLAVLEAENLLAKDKKLRQALGDGSGGRSGSNGGESETPNW